MDLLTAIECENTALLHPREFGESAVVTLGGGGDVRFQAVFDGDVQTVELGEHVARDGSAAILHCETRLVKDVRHGDACTVRETDYTVVGIENNGTGMSMLILCRAVV